MDFRTFIADKFIQNVEPAFPVKRKLFTIPHTVADARKAFEYLNNDFIRGYCTRIYYEGVAFIIEYAADSDTPSDWVDLDSPEFDDLVETE